VNLSLCLTKYHDVKTFWEVEVYFHAFSTSALDGGERSASRRCFNPSKNPLYRYPLDGRLGEPQSRSGRWGDEKIPCTFGYLTLLGGSLVTTAWRVLRLRMEERPPGTESSCE
jgi:hypothetical protein